MVVSKGITLLSKTVIFNDDIREWIQKSSDLKTWEKYNFCFSPSAPISEKSGNNRRKSWVNRDSAKHLRCTTALSRRAPWGDQRHTNNCAGNANTRLRAGSTGTIQCSTYQIEIHVNGTVGTDDCDHEFHAGSTKTTRIFTNQPSKSKKKVLLMEL